MFYLRYTLFIGIGIGILALVSTLLSQNFISSNYILVVFFSVTTIIFKKVLKIDSSRIKIYFKNYKLIIVGISLGFITHSVNLIIYRETLNFSIFLNPITLFSTFIIVLWEEIWFRNIVLTKSDLKVIPVSIFSASIFTLIHFLNPKFNFLEQSLNIFLGGFLLTYLFIYFKSFLLPLFFHLTNNLLENTYEITDSILPPYIKNFSTVILLLITVFFIIKLKKYEVSNNLHHE
jgi:membrane protease YdiL (CAAX protease family)